MHRSGRQDAPLYRTQDAFRYGAQSADALVRQAAFCLLPLEPIDAALQIREALAAGE